MQPSLTVTSIQGFEWTQMEGVSLVAASLSAEPLGDSDSTGLRWLQSDSWWVPPASFSLIASSRFSGQRNALARCSECIPERNGRFARSCNARCRQCRVWSHAGIMLIIDANDQFSACGIFESLIARQETITFKLKLP